MIDAGIVQGSYEASRPVVIGKTTVYVHDNVHEIEDEEGNALYEYHEVQYTKDEYIALMDEKLSRNAANIDYVAMMSDIDLPEDEESEE